ncbi:MAG: hypothetical protein IKG55_03970 [Solobacterium sp.]|nr:hypothetical protein [Solobacterium sp.]
MVIINVSAPLLRKQIRDKLRSEPSMKYTYLGKIGSIEMQFSVDTDKDPNEVVRFTKRLIRSMPYGNIIVYRVLADGQFFENGPIYKPGDPEYQATRPGWFDRKKKK